MQQSPLEHEDLNRILRDRHRCAHPSLNAEGERYAPPAELARVHIHSAVTHLLQHEPAQGKFALEHILSQIDSKYFPSNDNEVLDALKNGPLFRARASLVDSLTAVLLKSLFLKNKPDYQAHSRYIASLNALNSMHRVYFEERCAEVFPKIMAQVADERLFDAVSNLPKLHRGWEFLGTTQQGRLRRFVRGIPTKSFYIIDGLLDYKPLQSDANFRLKHASFEDLKEIIPILVPKGVIDRTIEVYLESKSFDEANKIALHMQTFAEDFSVDQVSELLSKIKDNDQIIGSFELPKLLESLRETVGEESVDLDDLLRVHGLEEYCEDGTEEETPF